MSPKCNRCHPLYCEVWLFSDEERGVYILQGGSNYQGYNYRKKTKLQITSLNYRSKWSWIGFNVNVLTPHALARCHEQHLVSECVKFTNVIIELVLREKRGGRGGRREDVKYDCTLLCRSQRTNSCCKWNCKSSRQTPLQKDLLLLCGVLTFSCTTIHTLQYCSWKHTHIPSQWFVLYHIYFGAVSI